MNTTHQRPIGDVLTALSYPENPQLSPDGGWVAYVATPYGRAGDHPEGSIWLAPTGDSAPARQFTSGQDRTIESMLGGSRPWDGPDPHQSMRHWPISYAKSISILLLILHGQNDARVPVSPAVGFHRALREIGVATKLVTYPREPHGIRERAHQRDMLRRVRDWFREWL